MKLKQIHKPLLLAIWLLLLAQTSHAALLRNIPQTVTLPDLTVVQCFSSGDEYFNWLHDESGYTLVAGDDGFLYYAIQKDDLLEPSNYRFHSVDPGSVGIRPGNLISDKAYRQRRTEYFNYGNQGIVPKAPHTGTMNNLVVFIRFSDDIEYSELTSFFDDMFNSEAVNANSMRKYYDEDTYYQLSISSTFYPVSWGSTVVSYQDSHPRNYYLPYDATSNPSGYQGIEKWEREHALLKAAAASIASAVPPGLNIDVDNDGNIDGICFVMKGAAGLWSSILWPHVASMGAPFTYINGKKANVYTIQIQGMLYTSGAGVLCHEMFHVLGAPDLYHNPGGGYANLSPVNKWDVMDNTTNPPQHMSAYMKLKYGLWIPNYTVLNTTGFYTLNPLNSTSSANVCYVINSPYSNKEYFIAEYRKRTGTFESSLPGSGLVVYRINSNFTGNIGYDGTTVFDEIYAYRPGGSTTANGVPDNANFSQLVGRNALNCTTDPTPYLSHGEFGGLDIREITENNNGTLTFLLLYNVPAGIVLNQPNTWGLFAALDEIAMTDGFGTTPSNSLRTLLSECSTLKSNEPVKNPSPALYEVQVLSLTGHWISSYSISSATGFDITAIRSIPDEKGNYLPDGAYKYVVSKEGGFIDRGMVSIK